MSNIKQRLPNCEHSTSQNPHLCSLSPSFDRGELKEENGIFFYSLFWIWSLFGRHKHSSTQSTNVLFAFLEIKEHFQKRSPMSGAILHILCDVWCKLFCFLTLKRSMSTFVIRKYAQMRIQCVCDVIGLCLPWLMGINRKFLKCLYTCLTV